uniref:Ferroptosis suppressor protein 1 n=1 Tax=Ciona savignyi TaxID=51511 RepID=H2YKV7_CIOSA
MAKYLGYALAGGTAVFGYRCLIDRSKKLSPEQHVVIVGGGYGGVRVAKQLKDRGNFTLIDPKGAMHHNMAALRAAVEPGFSPRSFIPYKPTFGDNFVQGRVTSIDTDNQSVTVDSKMAPIPYTQLVIATGSTGPFPGKCRHDLPTQQLQDLYENFTTEVRSAKNIVVVGGGAVGVEMAGEIAGDYPDKKVTVIHNSDVLINPKLSSTAQEKLGDKLDQKGINRILGEKVTNLSEIPTNKQSEGIEVELSSGGKVDADLVIPCFGVSTLTDAYERA